VIDSLGTAGLCAGPRCLVAIYTAAHTETRVQNQSLAFSEDGGQRWTQHAENPVLDIGSQEFRDPFVFWHAPTEAWIMTIAMATDHAIRVYRSPDLRRWELASEFRGMGATGGVWECPVLVALPDRDTGVRRWLLKIDLNPGHVAGGSGAQYFVGDFDGRSFMPTDTTTRWGDFGPDFYCAQPWQPANDDGSVTWIAWMSNWTYAADIPTGTWRGMMSLPRTVALRERAGRPVLVQQPIAVRAPGDTAVQRFTVREQVLADPTVLDISPGVAFEAELRIEAGRATEVGLLLRHSAQQHVLISYDPVASRVAIDRRPGGTAFHPAFRARYEATIPRDRLVTLRLVVDASSVELFADDGATVLTALIFPAPGSADVALFSKGGAVQSVELTVWPLGPRNAP
jgi:fructan beta-fructosidase